MSDESIKFNDTHIPMNTPKLLSPIGKHLDYDGTHQYQTVDKGNKELIICNNYININNKFSDI